MIEQGTMGIPESSYGKRMNRSEGFEREGYRGEEKR